MSFLDTRLGNAPIWYIDAPEDAQMRVPTAAIKSVCFLATQHIDDEGNRLVTLEGTGFFVSHPSEFASDLGHIYLVTAKHVADRLLNREFAVRLNGKDGKAFWIQGSAATRWYIHPTETADVAIVPFGPPRETTDFQPIPSSMFLNEEILARGTIGPGDEVFLTGLFGRVMGDTKNVPIVRTGNLAMLPDDEKIPTKMGEMKAYLIEARSIGGLSGSPAFVMETLRLQINDQPPEYISGNGSIYFLGLMHGHWDIPPEAKNDALDDDNGQVNLGIAIVVPAMKILEVIKQEELMQDRQQKAERRRSERDRPTMDMISEYTQETRAGHPVPIPTRAQFFRDLTKVTRKKK